MKKIICAVFVSIAMLLVAPLSSDAEHPGAYAGGRGHVKAGYPGRGGYHGGWHASSIGGWHGSSNGGWHGSSGGGWHGSYNGGWHGPYYGGWHGPYYGGWHGPYYGGWHGPYHGWGSGSYWGTTVFLGPLWYPYPYYQTPPVIVQQPPAAYAPSEPPQESYWYYCPDPQGYYPYIKSCPGGWMKVVPQVTPPEQ
jgi:hypothetical protein